MLCVGGGVDYRNSWPDKFLVKCRLSVRPSILTDAAVPFFICLFFVFYGGSKFLVRHAKYGIIPEDKIGHKLKFRVQFFLNHVLI